MTQVPLVPAADADAHAPATATVERQALLDQVLQSQVQAALAQDRQWMAAEVHDSVAQSLAYVKMRLPLLHDAMLAHDDTQALRYYEDVRGTLAQAHTHLRRILADLRAPVDATAGLPTEPRALGPALRELAQDFEDRASLPVRLQLPEADLVLPATQQLQVLRVVQEALANVARHAGAQQVWLRVASNAGHLALQVCDDGCGPAGMQPGGSHYGIDIMHGRARRLGGQLQVKARPEGGTCVSLAFPMEGTPRP